MILSKPKIEQIIKKAAWSPSGDNCQPWTFAWESETLSIFHDPIRGEHPLNPQCIASQLTLGTLIESISIAASEFKFETSFELEPLEVNKKSLWANIKFIERDPKLDSQPDPLAKFLLKRMTDRRNYDGGELGSQQLQDIFDVEKNYGSARLHFISKPPVELMKTFAEAEVLLLDHSKILPATLHWVRFTIETAKRLRDGISWRNLGTKFWELPMLPLMRDVPLFLRIMKGFASISHRQRVMGQLKTSAGLVCVSVKKNPDSIDLVNAGRLMMRTWLKLTSIGYGAQPMTIASMISYAANHGIMKLNSKWLSFFKNESVLIQKTFFIPDSNECIWMLRTGKSTPLPENARTFRKSVEEILRVSP